MSITILSLIDKRHKRSSYPSSTDGINKTWCIHRMGDQKGDGSVSKVFARRHEDPSSDLQHTSEKLDGSTCP